jgi:ankyrin repeat protein
LDKGADVNTKGDDGMTALMVAVRKINPSAVEYLLEKGADINAKDNLGRTALIILAELHYTTIGEALATLGESLGMDNDIAKTLIDKGADINVKDNNDKTALMYAIQNGHKEIVELLKKAEAKE